MLIALLTVTVVAVTWGQVVPDRSAGGLAPAADAPTGTGSTSATGPGALGPATGPATARLVGDLEKAVRRSSFASMP